MSLPIPAREHTLNELRTVTGKYTALLRSEAKPLTNAIGEWNVSQVAAHTSQIFNLFPKLIDGTGESPIRDHLNMGAEWQRHVDADPERDLKVLAQRIDDAVATFLDAATPEIWEEDRPWHGGLKAPVYSLACIIVQESAIHGLDIAQASGAQWDVTREQALLSIQGLMPILPNFLKAETAESMNATFELRLRQGPTVFITVQDGSLRIDSERPPKVDVVISADPVSYLLVGYGRTGQVGPILTGKIMSWGRKPLLALRFAKLFHSA